jgi:hypothetical protein
MKKLLSLLALLLISFIAIAQKNNTNLSNYEKYLLAKEKVDTLYNNDTVFVDVKSTKSEYEWDDLYYIAKRDSLRIESKTLRLKKKQLRFEQNEAYFDAVEQVQDAYSDLYFHPDYRIRLYFGFRPYYHYYSYWNPFYYDPFYDPFMYDPWYYSWNSPYSYPFYDNYWHGYNNWYYDWGWNWYSPRYHVNNYYNYYGSNTVGTQPIRMSKGEFPYGRRERQSTYSSEWNKRQPVTVNRTVQIDRGSGRVLSQSIRSVSDKQQNRTTPQQIQERKPITQDRPTYDQNRRTYTPSYSQPHMSVRPRYNNTNINRSPNEQRYNYNRNTPIIQYRNTAQSKVIYSTPKTSTPRTSTSNRSSYSNPSRSGSSYIENSSGRSSNSVGSSSGNSSSSRSSSGGSTSSGRR